MYRFLYFLAIIIIPTVFSWWLFIPMALLFVYLVKLPYEIILAGLLLDILYYFGDSFGAKYFLTIYSSLLILLALFLNKKIHWSKTI